MADEGNASDTRKFILHQIETLRHEFHERRSVTPPPTGAIETAYEIRMQRLYDALDAADGQSRAAS